MNDIDEKIKDMSKGFMALVLIIGSVAIISLSLMSYWDSRPKPKTFVVVSVERNKQDVIEDCDDPFVTSVRDVVTDQIKYVCGKRGVRSQIVEIFSDDPNYREN